MIDCVYQHIGDDGVIVCNKYSNFVKGIITFCEQKIGCTGKKPTNADKLRAMNDEELAKFLDFCPPNMQMKTPECYQYYPNCEQCWLDWLGEETE